MSYAEAVHGDIMIGIVNEEGKELCKPMYCKDFLQDMFAAELFGHKVGIWGFSWTPGQIPFNSKTFSWSLHFKRKDLVEKAHRIQDLLNVWEKHLGMKPLSTLHPVGDGKVAILTFPRGWMEQPIRVSAVSLLLRVAPEWDGKEGAVDFMRRIASLSGKIPEKNPLAFWEDAGYVKKSLDRWERLWEKKEWEKQDYEMYEKSTSELHHHSGMVSYMRERTA